VQHYFDAGDGIVLSEARRYGCNKVLLYDDQMFIGAVLHTWRDDAGDDHDAVQDELEAVTLRVLGAQTNASSSGPSSKSSKTQLL
jgi:hypothetical protein